jgi:hypothetical protein
MPKNQRIKIVSIKQTIINFLLFLILLCIKVNSSATRSSTQSKNNQSFVKNGTDSNNSTQNNHDSLRVKIEIFRNLLYLYYLPLIVLVGIIGNSMTLLIVSLEKKLLLMYDSTKTFNQNMQASLSANNHQSKGGKSIKRNLAGVHFSTSNYFIGFLSISDLIYNIILMLVWITRVGFNILNTRYICEVSIALSYICSFLSAAFTTMFTFQRFMACVYPLKSATSYSLQSKSKIKCLTFILIVFSCFIYSFSLFMYDAEPKKQHEESTELQNICSIKNGYNNIVNIIDNTLDSFLTLIIPSFCILFMNIAIIKTISNSQNSILKKIQNISKRKKKEQENKQEALNEESSFFIEKDKDQEGLAQISNAITVNEQDSNKNAHIQKTQGHKTNTATSNSHITQTLLVVSFFFILLNCPYRASKLISYIQMTTKKTEVYSNFDFAMNEVLINLYFTSYSVNFFLYSLCGKKFRQSLKALVFLLILFLFKSFMFVFRRKRLTN